MTASDPISRFDVGWERLTRLNGTNDPRVVRELRELAPELARWIVEFGYGDAYAPKALDEQQRQLVTIGTLTGMGGCEDQLGVHIAVALNVGLGPDEVIEAIQHAIPYAGFPRVINALGVARRVFERRGVWTSDAWRDAADAQATRPGPPASDDA